MRWAGMQKPNRRRIIVLLFPKPCIEGDSKPATKHISKVTKSMGEKPWREGKEGLGGGSDRRCGVSIWIIAYYFVIPFSISICYHTLSLWVWSSLSSKIHWYVYIIVYIKVHIWCLLFLGNPCVCTMLCNLTTYIAMSGQGRLIAEARSIDIYTNLFFFFCQI